MKKILDNSAVSSMGKEITSVNVLDIVSSQYELVMTSGVLRECKNLGDGPLYERVSQYPLAVTEGDQFKRLVDAIKKVNYRLGPGEINTIAASIILNSQGVENYVVIDEALARRIVMDIHKNPLIAEIMGHPVSQIKCAGTVGLLAHLRDKGVISKDDANRIAYDLQVSNFRVSEQLLNLLR